MTLNGEAFWELDVDAQSVGGVARLSHILKPLQCYARNALICVMLLYAQTSTSTV